MSKDLESELQFTKIIRKIIKEENCLKAEDVKKIAEEILKQIDPLIAKHVKNHFYEIGKFISDFSEINNIVPTKNEVENNAQTFWYCFALW